MPHLAQKIPTYSDFASRDIEGIIGPGIKSALHFEVTEFKSGIFNNQGNGQFVFTPFPKQVQESLINSILYEDFDGDGIFDLLLAGNNHMSEIETTRADAGIGSFLKGTVNGIFQSVSHLQSGFFADKDVRNLLKVDTASGFLIFVINNNSRHDLFKVDRPTL